MKQHKIGIIVYGIVGKRKREYIDLNPYFQTHYVRDVNFDGEGNFSDGVYYFKDYREIFDHELDIVFVSWLLLTSFLPSGARAPLPGASRAPWDDPRPSPRTL